MGLHFCYVTTKNKDEASSIGKRLVEEKIIACANIIEKMNSIYHWGGKVVEDEESILIAKTTSENLDRFISLVNEVHSYEVPCIITLDITNGSKDYLSWVKESCI